MEREILLKLYNRLTGFVEKLPGGLQKPILRELVPIRETFLESRPASLLLLGNDTSPPSGFLANLGMKNLEVCGLVDNGWRTFESRALGAIQLLDARAGSPVPEAALLQKKPDLIVWLQGPEMAPASTLSASAALLRDYCPASIPLVAWAIEPSAAPRAASAIAAERQLSSRGGRIFHDREFFAEAVCELLPNPAKLSFARLTAARKAQATIARSLLKSFSAVCGVIGVQPIPLADLPILTTLQTLMVTLIIQTTQRRASPKLVAEFLGALGFNIGAGFLFRESARALIKIFPFWGNAVSGLVAGAGTYAIGQAAIAYFIEGLPVEETRRLFSKLKPGSKTFAHAQLPPPLPEPGDSEKAASDQ